MEQSRTISVAVCAAAALVALCAGAAGGYWYGFSAGNIKGFAAGKEAAAEEQARAAAAVQEEKRSELQNAANPFKGSYQNPFAD